MSLNRLPLRQPIRVQRPVPRIAGVSAAPPTPMMQAAIKPVAGRAPNSWDKERRRGVIAALAVAFALGGLVAGYGVHTQMSKAAARLEARNFQVAMTTVAALRSGTVLFIPEDGNVCRRRWIDNATWMLRDAGEIPCEEAANWFAAVPVPQHRVETRIDAIRTVFQAKGAGKLE